jgi:hypothetical protein
MAEYVPLFLPGNALTKSASATVTGGQPVYVSGNGTVANTSANTQIAVGVAAFDVANGERVTFFGRGTVHRLTASGAITAGALVEMAAGGQVAQHTPGAGVYGSAFGVALTTGSTGNPVEVMEI